MCYVPGLKYYDDLNTAVGRPEADALAQIILADCMQLVPGITVDLVGGFRR